MNATAPATLSAPDLKFRITQSDAKGGLTPERFESTLRQILDDAPGSPSFSLKVTPLPSGTEYTLKINGDGGEKERTTTHVLGTLDKQGLVNTLMDGQHRG
jgi:hypothetical protein